MTENEMDWRFYGRRRELDELVRAFARGRFFFVRVTGRRRIGKTTLVRRALETSGRDRILYVQIPDSAPGGIVSAVRDAMETFGVTEAPPPASLFDLAQTLGRLIRAGYVVALDEFQYFSRKSLNEFLSHLQATVDALVRDAVAIRGGLVVLGSIHAELTALLDDRDTPLYNRATDAVELGHLDIGSVVQILDAHADRAPERLLFLWNLFEGVPKFYRDCFEQGVLGADRPALLARMFFGSSSPLRAEADNWFLGELRGRYDVVLKFIARHPGCTHGDLEAHVRDTSPETTDQVAGYIRVLADRYQLIERRLPVFAKATARSGRYHIRDNFLRSWLAALHGPAAAINFRPEHLLVAQADARLAEAEGQGFERLVAQLYAERSRRGLGDFCMTHRVEGYWDKKDTEIDLVAVDEDAHRIRFVTCKRDPDRLRSEPDTLRAHVARFLEANRKFAHWHIELAACAPRLETERRAELTRRGLIAQDLTDLTTEL
jgi:AAA+ ATPase superfamily predicted ATPase